MKMREVVGAFGSFSKLSEALEELCSEGIAPDRVRVATACAPPEQRVPTVNRQPERGDALEKRRICWPW